MSQSITCVWCTRPLLDGDHAKKHVLTQCPKAPATMLYLAAKQMLAECTLLVERGSPCVPSIGALDHLQRAVDAAEGRS